MTFICSALQIHPDTDKVSDPKGVTEVPPPLAELALLDQTGILDLLLLRSLQYVARFAESHLRTVGICGLPRVLSVTEIKHHGLP